MSVILRYHGRNDSGNTGHLLDWKDGDGAWADFPTTLPAAVHGRTCVSIGGSASSELILGLNTRYVCTWNGISWTVHDLDTLVPAEAPYWYLVVSPTTVNGTAWFVGIRGSQFANNRGALLGYLSGVWTNLFDGFGFGHLGNSSDIVCPLAISATECLFTHADTRAGTCFFKWTLAGGVVQHPLGTLPTGAMNGVVQHNGELFILYQNGNVYRGTWGGTWTLDNATDGPFPGIPTGVNNENRFINVAVDDSTICVGTMHTWQGFWVRNGPDDWTNLGPTGIGNVVGQCAMNDNKYLVVSEAGETEYSDDGGSSWSTAPGPLGSAAQGAFALGTDTDPPTLSNQSPAPGERDVSKLANIEFDVTDAEDNLSASTIEIYVNGLLVWVNEAASNGWSGFTSTITKGLHFTLTPSSFYQTAVVTVNVIARDLAGNLMDESYEFYPSVDLMLLPVVLAERLIRVNFSRTIALSDEALDKDNWTVAVADTGAESIDVLRVVWDAEAAVLAYVDLFISPVVPSEKYQISASGLLFETGSMVGDTIGGQFVAQATKVDSVVDRLSNMYDTSINSNLFHILLSIGIIDEKIGGETVQLVSSKAAITVVEEEEDMMVELPRLTYAGISSITVIAPPGHVATVIRVQLQDNNFYSFGGPQTWDPSVSGIGGRDTGIESNGWWYLYLVVDAGVLKPIGSLNKPSIGPVDQPLYRYFGSVLNVSGDLFPFYHIDNTTFMYPEMESDLTNEPATLKALSKTALHTPAALYSISDLVPPETASAVYCDMLISRQAQVGTAQLFMQLFTSDNVDLVSTGILSAKRYVTCRNAYLSTEANDRQCQKDAWLPLPPTSGHPEIGFSIDRDAGTVVPANFFMRIGGYKDGYR
jgi:hypothetical protein